MQNFYNITDAIRQYLNANINVNTVRLGNINEIDLHKQTIYPLAHIIMGDVDFRNNVMAFDIKVIVMDSVVESNTDLLTEDDIFKGIDNKQDVYNTTLAVINGLQAQLRGGDLYQNKYQLDGDPIASPFEDEYTNVLTGWALDFTVIVANDQIGTCDFVLDLVNGGVSINDLMQKAIYDINNSGVVDDSERLGGELPSYYATQSDLTLINVFTSSIQSEVDNLAAQTGSYLTELPSGTVSGSSQIEITESQISDLTHFTIADLPSGTVSGSSQIDHNATTNYDVDQHFTQAEISITESQISDLSHTIIPSGTISGSSQISITESQISDLKAYQVTSQKGQANGYASLDAGGLVPATQLPSYVDDVIEVNSYANLPVTGEIGKIYVTIDNNKTYRWSGSVYVYITSGAVDSVAGKTGIVTLVKGDVGLSNVDNTSDLNKPISIATQFALDAKVDDSQVLTNVPSGALFTDTIYVLPNNIVSGSAQIVPLLPTGTVSGSTQIAFSGITGKPTLVSGSSQLTSSYDTRYETRGRGIVSGSSQLNGSTFTNIIASGSFSGSFYGDGSNLSGVTSYTNTDTLNYINSINVISGSSQVSYVGLSNIPAGIVSGAAQIPSILPTGTVSGSSQVSFTTISNKPTLVSGSSQVIYTQLSSIPSGIVSGSSQVVSILSSLNTYTSSNDTLNTTQNSRLTSIETVTGSLATTYEQKASGTHTLISGSSQVSFTTISNKPTLISSSLQVSITESQITDLTHTDISLLNTFTGSIQGEVNSLIAATGSYLTSLPVGTISGSSQISITESQISDLTHTVIPTGTVSGSSQIILNDTTGLISASRVIGDIQASSVEYVNILNKPTLISSSLQVSITQSQITDLDHYTDADTLAYINSKAVVSGSVLTALPSGVISGSSQISITESQISDLSHTDISLLNSFTSSIQSEVNSLTAVTSSYLTSLPSGVVSGSSQISITESQISDLTHYTDADTLAYIDSKGVVSGSVVIAYTDLTGIPSGIVSGSSQVSYTGITNVPAGIVSGSSQVTPLLPTGTVSGSSQIILTDTTGNISGSRIIGDIQASSVDWINVLNQPIGLVSGSSQLTSSYDSRYQVTSQKGQANGYASLDANSFVPMNQLSGSVFTKNDFADIKRQGITDRAETTIAFDGTNTFTITPTATQWSYYRSGYKYTVTGAKSVVITGSPIAAGTWFIYIDDTIGTLTASQTVWTFQDTKVPIAAINFNNALTPKFWISDERHSISIDRFMQYYLHFVDGARSLNTPTLSGYTLNTDTNVSKTFGISAGTLIDQDIVHQLPLLTDPDGTATDYAVWYRSAIGTWEWKLSNMPFLYNTSTNWIQYDNDGTATDLSGGAGGLTRWTNSYLLLTNKAGAARFIIVPGREVFTTLAAAKAESISEFDWTGFPLEESVIAYQLTWTTITSTSQGKCRLADTPTLVNISTITNNSSGAGTDHNTLSNLQGGTLGEYYHITAAEKAVVANTSGINTGDQDLSSYITTLPSGTVSGSSQLDGTTINNLTLTNAFASGSFSGSFHSDYVTFNTIPQTTSIEQGTVSWNDGDGTLDLILKGGLTTLQLGQEQHVMTYNDSGVPLVDGDVVYIKGAQGNRISVGLAANTIEWVSSVTIGLVTEPIAMGAEGFVTTFGLVRNLNTLGLTEGLPIYLGATTGSYTQVKPVAPAHTVIVGYVIRAHESVGSIFVKVYNGFELDELHDVLITDKQNDNGLFYESATQLWKNKTVASVLPTGTISGSSQVSYTGLSSIPAGIVSGAAQVTPLLPTGTVSGSSQVSFTTISNKPTLVSGSSQVSYVGLSNIPSGIVSGSSQVVSILVPLNTYTGSNDTLNTTQNSRLTSLETATGSLATTYEEKASGTHTLVSGSSQVVYTQLSSIPIGIVSGSSQISYIGLSNIPAGIVSGSSQINADTITNFDPNVLTYINTLSVVSGSVITSLPSGTVSGSSQITLSATTGYSTLATTYEPIASGTHTLISGSSQLAGTSIDNITLINVSASGSFSGSFFGDGSNLTGIAAGDPNFSTPATGKTLAGASATSGDYSTAVGTSADAAGTYDIAIGALSTTNVGYLNQIAIGHDAAAVGYSAIAIGSGSISDNTGAIAVGDTSNASGYGSIAIGYLSNTTNTGIGIGYNTSTTAADAISIGTSATATNTRAVSIGWSADALGDRSTAIGGSTYVGSTHTRSVAIGYLATTTKAYQIALGGNLHTEVYTSGSVVAESFQCNVANDISGSDAVLKVVSCTQAEYDAGTPVATTLYIING